MVRISLLIITLLYFSIPVMAIDWIGLQCPTGRQVFLDKDSIKEEDNCYFYNIKFKDMHGYDIVVTMQSAKHNPFSARLKVYKISEYEALSGDYENITKNKTTKLEPVTYTSTVYTCYKKVKELKQIQNIPEITF